MSRCAEKKCRQLEIVERERQITVNYEQQTVQISRCVNNPDGQVEIRETPVFPKSEPLKLELADFVRCVIEKRPPVVGGKDGKRALEVAVEVLRQINETSGISKNNNQKIG